MSIPIYSKSGLVEVITWFIIIWSSLHIVTRFINYKVIIHLFTNMRSNDKLKKKNINQNQMNKLFESPENKINLNYA